MRRDVTCSSTPAFSPRRARFHLAGGCLLAALAAPPVVAQEDFRRGDTNTDGVVDVSDACFLGRWLFIGDTTLSCRSAGETNGDGSIDLSDEVFLLNWLFLGGPQPPPPGPDPGPDPNPGGQGCVAYEPAAPPKHADLDLAFECLGMDPSGEPGLLVAVTLTTRNNSAGEGAEAWSLSIGAEGYRILNATTVGTAAALTTASPPGYRDPDSSLSTARAIDPDLGSQGPGAVSAVQLRVAGSAQLPSEGKETLLMLRVEEDPPGGPDPHRLFFEDGKLGSGQPVRNVITIRGASQTPNAGTLEACTVDCNSNGRADELDIFMGTSKDCNESSIPDECEIASGATEDCNSNGIPDACDIAAGQSTDCDENSVPDECDPDCNSNGTSDPCDIAQGTSHDCNANGIPDDCDGFEDPSDCNTNGKPDRCDILSGTSEDCNSNEIPDSCDVAAGRSTDCDGNSVPDECEQDCNTNGIVDACDIESGKSADADGDGIPDECRCDCLCPATNPIPCGPGDAPQFRLGFRGGCEAAGSPATLRLKAFATLEQFCLPAGNRGAQGWGFGVLVLEGTPISATTSGTAAAPTTEGGFRNPMHSFETTQIIDPARNEGKRGAVTAVALSTGGPGIFELPPATSPYDVLQLEVELSSTGSCPRAALRYEEDLAGRGQPIRNTVTYQGASRAPLTGEATWERCGGGGSQSAGDGNQDGLTNIADAIWLLGHLFLGTQPVLPCDGGTATAPAAGALALLDANGDGAINLTDAIGILNYLFSSGPPPALGTGCVPVQGCADMCAAP